MIDERKIPKSKTEDLELNRETIADLTDTDAERVLGGAGKREPTEAIKSANRISCAYTC
jgi:hypothetical protein